MRSTTNAQNIHTFLKYKVYFRTSQAHRGFVWYKSIVLRLVKFMTKIPKTSHSTTPHQETIPPEKPKTPQTVNTSETTESMAPAAHLAKNATTPQQATLAGMSTPNKAAGLQIQSTGAVQKNQQFLDIDAGEGGLETSDLAVITADMAGIIDPTPISDGISGLISLGKGDFSAAGLSVVSMIPYLGDAGAKPLKLARALSKSFPALSRLLKTSKGFDGLTHTLKALGPSIKSPVKLNDTLKSLNNMHKAAEVAYKNPKWLKKIKNMGLPTDGPIVFVPPKKWNPKNPLRTSDKKGFLDAFGNQWRKGPSRTPGQAWEWDVVPRGQSSLKNLSRDGSHLNVSLGGKVTHR
jgi:hypothetical protein